MARIVTLAAGVLLLCCMPSGCCHQCWHRERNSELVPPHSKFHPVPTQQVFGTPANLKLANRNGRRDDLTHPDTSRVEEILRWDENSAPPATSSDVNQSVKKSANLSEADFDSVPAIKSVLKSEPKIIPEPPPLEQPENTVRKIHWRMSNSVDENITLIPKTPGLSEKVTGISTVERVSGWHPRSSRLR